jgi:hypothetical protein
MKYNGKVYQVISDKYDVKIDVPMGKDRHFETFKIMDLNTGEITEAGKN